MIPSPTSDGGWPGQPLGTQIPFLSVFCLPLACALRPALMCCLADSLYHFVQCDVHVGPARLVTGLRHGYHHFAVDLPSSSLRLPLLPARRRYILRMNSYRYSCPNFRPAESLRSCPGLGPLPVFGAMILLSGLRATCLLLPLPLLLLPPPPVSHAAGWTPARRSVR